MRFARLRVALAIVLAAASAAWADEPSRPGALLDVPFVAQTEALCGGASVAMVQRYWGAREVSAADFASLVDSRLNGIPASRLTDAVQRQGWQALALDGTPDLIRHHVESGRPIIVMLQVGPNQRHYVVVVSWSAERVLYHDPASLPFRTLSPAAFDRLWAPTSRWMLLLLPSRERTTHEPTTEAAVPESVSALIELAGDQLFRVHLEIAVGVVHQPQVRWFRDEHAAIEDLDRPRQDEAIGEHGSLVHPAVTVDILQHHDASDRFVFVGTGEIRHESGHLNHPQPALEVPVERDRLLDERLARDQLDAIPGRHVEALERPVRRKRW